MKKRPLVSVIIPTFNRFAMLCEAIDSVLAQTFSDFEIIVVDDGSYDETGSISARYGPSIKYIFQKNQGVSVSRNRGIREAEGDFICFLDSDDLWLPRKLAVQYAKMIENPAESISYTEEIWYRRGVRVNPKRKHAKHGGWIFTQCLPLCIISPSSVMIRKSLFQDVGLFDEGLPVCEDYDLWLRIAKNFPIRLIQEPLIIKRNGHPGQLSASDWGFDRYRVQSIVQILASGTLSPDQAEAAVVVMTHKCRILCKGFLKRGKTEEAAAFAKLLQQ
jgi:glycosyltransferase involved in cell wall biosynthesis